MFSLSRLSLQLRPQLSPRLTITLRAPKNTACFAQQHTSKDFNNVPIVQLVQRKLQERTKLQSEVSHAAATSHPLLIVSRIRQRKTTSRRRI